MSLGIAFKGPEGIVLAADSRVTLTAETHEGPTKMMLPSTFDNATKLLHTELQRHIGVVTYGLGAIGQAEPRTAHSFMPEFENKSQIKCNRVKVEFFATKFGEFFMRQWEGSKMPKDYSGPDMVFLVGGFDEGQPYGRVYQIMIPRRPEPVEQNPGQFGVAWGGQLEYTNRLIKGYDPRLPEAAQKFLGLSDEKRSELEKHLEGELSAHIPYAFLPLQDCIDLSIFLVRATMEMQTWTVDVRGVGGAIDVATITRIDGFQPVQHKKIVGQIKTL